MLEIFCSFGRNKSSIFFLMKSPSVLLAPTIECETFIADTNSYYCFWLNKCVFHERYGSVSNILIHTSALFCFETWFILWTSFRIYLRKFWNALLIFVKRVFITSDTKLLVLEPMQDANYWILQLYSMV